MPPEIVNPLSVSIQKSNKKRLILDLRYINLHFFKNKFKCEDMAVARGYQAGWSFAYFWFKVWTSTRWYFPGVYWIFIIFLDLFRRLNKVLFVFNAPIWSLNCPLLVYQIIKAFAQEMAKWGKAIVVFLDDGLGVDATFNLAQIASLQVHSDLLKFGPLPNEDKCTWIPATS